MWILEMIDAASHVVFPPLFILLLPGLAVICRKPDWLNGRRRIWLFLLFAFVTMMLWRGMLVAEVRRYFCVLIVPGICLAALPLLLSEKALFWRGAMRIFLLIYVCFAVGKALNPPFHKGYLLELGDDIKADIASEKFFEYKVWLDFDEDQRAGYYADMEMYPFQDRLLPEKEFFARYDDIMGMFNLYDVYYLVLRGDNLDELTAELTERGRRYGAETTVLADYAERSRDVRTLKIEHDADFNGRLISQEELASLRSKTPETVKNGNFSIFSKVDLTESPWRDFVEKFGVKEFSALESGEFPVDWIVNPHHTVTLPGAGLRIINFTGDVDNGLKIASPDGGLIINSRTQIPAGSYTGVIAASGSEGSKIRLFLYCDNGAAFVVTVPLAVFTFKSDNELKEFCFTVDKSLFPDNTDRFRLAIGVESGTVTLHYCDLQSR